MQKHKHTRIEKNPFYSLHKGKCVAIGRLPITTAGATVLALRKRRVNTNDNAPHYFL